MDTKHYVLPPGLIKKMDDAYTRVHELEKFDKIPKNYFKFVDGLFKDMGNRKDYLHHAGTGIASEAGELIDATKRVWAYNEKPNAENILEELGDLFFYAFAMMQIFGFSSCDVITWNKAKLAKRYGGAEYSDEAAIKRVDKDGD